MPNRSYDNLTSRETRCLLDFFLDHVDCDHRRKLAAELPMITAKLGILTIAKVREIASARLDEIEADPENCRVSQRFEVPRALRLINNVRRNMEE